jgi:hypothetical protein
MSIRFPSSLADLADQVRAALGQAKQLRQPAPAPPPAPPKPSPGWILFAVLGGAVVAWAIFRKQ